MLMQKKTLDLPAGKQATRQQNAIIMAFCSRPASCPLLSAYWKLLPIEKVSKNQAS